MIINCHGQHINTRLDLRFSEIGLNLLRLKNEIKQRNSIFSRHFSLWPQKMTYFTVILFAKKTIVITSNYIYLRSRNFLSRIFRFHRCEIWFTKLKFPAVNFNIFSRCTTNSVAQYSAQI